MGHTPLASPPLSRRHFLGFLGIGAAATALSGCGVGQGSAIEIEPGDPIRIGVIPTASNAPLYVAMDQGLFDDAGLTIETQISQNAAAVAPSVLNGQLQMGNAASSPFIQAAHKGIPVRAVSAASSNSTGDQTESAIIVLDDSPAQSPADLESMTVAVNGMASLPHVAAMESMHIDGGDPRAATFVAMPFPDMVGALNQGRIDAAAMAEPFKSQALAAGQRSISGLYQDAFPPGATTTLFFTAIPFTETNSEVVTAFQECMTAAGEMAAQDLDLVKHVLQNYGGMQPEALESMNFPTYGEPLTPDGLEEISHIMVRHNFIDAPLTAEELVL